LRSVDRERRGSISEDDEDLESGRHGLMMNYESDSDRRHSVGASVLNTPQMRSQRLIGNSNPRYKWWVHRYSMMGGQVLIVGREKYYKGDEELKGMRKPM
jgi:hypothetical protein